MLHQSEGYQCKGPQENKVVSKQQKEAGRPPGWCDERVMGESWFNREGQ